MFEVSEVANESVISLAPWGKEARQAAQRKEMPKLSAKARVGVC